MTGEGFALNSQLCLISDYFLFLFPSVQIKVDVTSLWLTFEATSQLHSRTPHLFCDSAPAAVAWPAVLWQKSPRGTLTVDAWSSWTPWPDSWLRHSWRSQITAVFCKLGQKLGKDTTLKRTWCKHIFVSLLAGLTHTFFASQTWPQQRPPVMLRNVFGLLHGSQKVFWYHVYPCLLSHWSRQCPDPVVYPLTSSVLGLAACAVYVSVWL